MELERYEVPSPIDPTTPTHNARHAVPGWAGLFNRSHKAPGGSSRTDLLSEQAAHCRSTAPTAAFGVTTDAAGRK